MPVDRTCLLNGDDLYVADVRCQDPPHGWTALRPATVFGLVMVRRGLFRGRIDGVEQLLDPTTVYVERMGSEQQFAHPCGGDAYTELVLSEPQVAALLGGDPRCRRGWCSPLPGRHSRSGCSPPGRATAPTPSNSPSAPSRWPPRC
ncbi:hypothetical protein ACFWOG_35620 [Kitasatospora sp. NPDC058406]|uniref:hypothetical protein n=1 Tax=Kitasatospora sp. NPDC058406 TaxID=3346483 RepID=UPI0036661C0B